MIRKTKDIHDYEELYRKYYLRLYYFAYDFVEDIDTSKDIVNEVFEAVWNNWQQMDKNRIGSYLYVSVKNQCVNYLRRNRPTVSYEQFLNIISNEDPEYWLEMEELLEEISREIDMMPPKTRRVFEECYFNNHTYKEASDIIGITPSGIKKHIVKGLAVLREHFEIKINDKKSKKSTS